MQWTLTQLNTMGGAFVGLATTMLLESAVLVGLALAIEAVLRNRVRATLRCWLVTLVLAHLVLIPLLSLSPPSTHWPSGKAAYADPISPMPARHTNAPLSQRATEQSQTTASGVGERPRTLTWQGTLFLLWLLGAGGIGAVLAGRAVKACRRVDNAPSANHLMKDLCEYCRRRMGVRSRVRLKVGREGTKPTVCGLFSPVIVVPRDLAPTLGSRHLRDVLYHELAHIRRRDHWVNFALTALGVLYFYNPLILAAGAAIRRLRDEAADEAVLQTIGDPDHLYARRMSDVATLTRETPPRSLQLIGVG